MQSELAPPPLKPLRGKFELLSLASGLASEALQVCLNLPSYSISHICTFRAHQTLYYVPDACCNFIHLQAFTQAVLFTWDTHLTSPIKISLGL